MPSGAAQSKQVRETSYSIWETIKQPKDLIFPVARAVPDSQM